MANHQDHANLIWQIADLLRGPYRPPQYERVMLPMTVLRRFDCVLAPTKAKVLAEQEKRKGGKLSADALDRMLNKAAGQRFHNHSPLTFEKLKGDPDNIEKHLVSYIKGFSANIRTIFEFFEFETEIEKMREANILYLVVSKFCDVDLHPGSVPNEDMGLIFENLIRRFNELANETAGDHFTPREVIRLMVHILFIHDDQLLSIPGTVRKLLDPACGTGGMLAEAQSYLRDHHAEAKLYAYGQDYNKRAFATAASDMLMKEVDHNGGGDNVRFGDSFTDDQFPDETFDYLLTNPPFGVDWKKQQKEIQHQHDRQGIDGRFGAGLPRVNDGSLLFLQHMISKFEGVAPAQQKYGSRLAIVFSGSPLFSGGAGSGESDIRKWIIEKDWLEAIIALPVQMFYNTGIATYVWIVTNWKEKRRKGKIQLLDAREYYVPMRRNLGDKRYKIGEGTATHFLPFNRGCKGGAGNPPDLAGKTYRTGYLWEEVLQRDSLLDLLARFVHLQVEEKHDDQGRKVKKETMIFPRYHQLQAVRTLVEAARKEGVGHNYLVEHSAGSGKSNTIGWLAHRLASLHSEQNERIFDSVIVVTDRVVLDQQLQDTIYQFEHKRGVVQKIDESSRQLAEALESAVPIIITTLQKFPFVSRQLLKMAEGRGEAGNDTLPTRHCAVIIDEAHSSQSGETATKLKGVLGGEALRQEAAARAAEEGAEDMEELFRSMAARGRQANLSFFAFTATPKHKTLKVFGRDGEPAHKYTMRQAIEEEFILDVLKHYTTYTAYFKLLKARKDDPNVERKKAARALARFLKLHPHNIIQKTEVMIEHFQAFTRHKIGGRAKAMVVTGSRLEAVRYKQNFDRYIKAKGYPIKSLVAFSGTVQDDKAATVSYTEEGMNLGIKQKELPEKFATQEYHVLLVAEKYQTGFDQPLLHTMYVDKRLAGIQAVQTLSRLNRIHLLKEDTFVLDFVNKREEIQEAFKTYYEGAEMGEEVDPARMYQLKAELDASGVYLAEERDRFCQVYFKPKQRQSAADHQAMNAALDPAVSRFSARQRENEDEAELWRGKLQAYRNLYGFLSQVIPYQDSDLEKLYVFLRHLGAKLPRRRGGPAYQFDDDVRLEYYRLQKISEGSIDLREGSASPLDGPSEVGGGMVREQPVALSQLIDILNARLGTDFNQSDQLFFDQIIEVAIADAGLRQAAVVNPGDKFELVFKNLLESLFVERMDQNEEIFIRFMNDTAFQKLVTGWLSSEAYKKLRCETGR